jgi:hypothetical protein
VARIVDGHVPVVLQHEIAERRAARLDPDDKGIVVVQEQVAAAVELRDQAADRAASGMCIFRVIMGTAPLSSVAGTSARIVETDPQGAGLRAPELPLLLRHRNDKCNSGAPWAVQSAKDPC